MAETGRLTWRDDKGLIVETPDGRVLAQVEVVDTADFTKAPGIGWMQYDAFEIKWLQLVNEPAGHVDGTCEEIPVLPLLGPGDA